MINDHYDHDGEKDDRMGDPLYLSLFSHGLSDPAKAYWCCELPNLKFIKIAFFFIIIIINDVIIITFP